MEGLGFVVGLILALLLAFAITMSLVNKSNDLGKIEECFEDFARGPMKYLYKYDEKERKES